MIDSKVQQDDIAYLARERDAAVLSAANIAEVARVARQRLAEVITYLTVTPDDTPMAEVRAECASIARGEHEPGRPKT
jgi:hypothetical protein